MYNILVLDFDDKQTINKEVRTVKSMKLILSLASAVIVLSAAVCAVVIFQEELYKLFRSCCDYCSKTLKTAKEEFEDFADV